MYKVICNVFTFKCRQCPRLRSPSAPSSSVKNCTACSTFSSLLIVLTLKTKKRLYYTLNTLHNTLTIHSTHAKCHKSLKTRYLYHCHYYHHCRCLSFSTMPISTNRKVGIMCFLLANTFVRKACFYCFFLHQTRRNIRKKVWGTLFIVSLILLGLSIQFKNWYIV